MYLFVYTKTTRKSDQTVLIIYRYQLTLKSRVEHFFPKMTLFGLDPSVKTTYIPSRICKPYETECLRTPRSYADNCRRAIKPRGHETTRHRTQSFGRLPRRRREHRNQFSAAGFINSANQGGSSQYVLGYHVPSGFGSVRLCCVRAIWWLVGEDSARGGPGWLDEDIHWGGHSVLQRTSLRRTACGIQQV